MNKNFVLGIILGALTGSTATYFITKKVIEDQAADEIERYSKHCRDKIDEMKGILEDAMVGNLDEEDEEPEPEDERITNNEGVKKYHHYDGQELPEYASKRVFGKNMTKDSISKEDKEDIKEAVKKKTNSKLISEITEDEFLNDDEKYTKQTIDILMMPEERAFWGYQTDNEMEVEAKFGKTVEELVGDDIDWAEIADEDGIGVLYFRNDEIMTDFEVVVHVDIDGVIE